MADQEDGVDGSRLLTSIDLYEISLTATPMHPDTRVVSWKTAANRHDQLGDREFALLGHYMSPDETQRKRAEELGIEELAKKARPARIARFEV
jgi:hypothetical protein